VHKFGAQGVDDFDAFIEELEAQPSPTVGEVFVFVDECHRTQSGKLHRVMKAMMPNAVFIGFTGTPLLKQDKQTSLEVFRRLHPHLQVQRRRSKTAWCSTWCTRRATSTSAGLTPTRSTPVVRSQDQGPQRLAEGRAAKQWGTMQSVLSSRSRMERVVADIVFDFSVKPRLSSERGNAILVASSIYEACKYFVLFQKTPFKGKCAVVTSYNPQART
jgi:type I restriction enzyme R subunit